MLGLETFRRFNVVLTIPAQQLLAGNVSFLRLYLVRTLCKQEFIA